MYSSSVVVLQVSLQLVELSNLVDAQLSVTVHPLLAERFFEAVEVVQTPCCYPTATVRDGEH